MKYMVEYICPTCNETYKEYKNKPAKRKRKKVCATCRLVINEVFIGEEGKRCQDCIYWKSTPDTNRFFKKCEKGCVSDDTDAQASSRLRGFTCFEDSCLMFKSKDDYEKA